MRNSMSSAALYISRFFFVALDCEARPFIHKLKMKKQLDHKVFPIYRNEDTVLVVSGVGKVAMAAAVAYALSQLSTVQYPLLVNIGIAGHKDHDLGELFLAEKIIDAETNKRYFPLMLPKGIAGETLETVSSPVTGYTSNHLYEMEASAFFEIGSKFTSHELIHCLKLVSDNRFNSIKTIKPEMVKELIETRLRQICQLIQLLQQRIDYTEPVMEIPEYASIIQLWHFSSARQQRLKQLLKRWKVLNSNQAYVFQKDDYNSAQQFLLQLEDEINSLPVRF